MFVIIGGSFEEKNYSCMYEAGYKYAYISPNERYFFQWGIKENEESEKGKKEKQAMLIFDTEGDALVYATTDKPLTSDEDYEKAIQELTDELEFLSDPSLRVSTPLNETAKEVVITDEMKENMMDIPTETN